MNWIHALIVFVAAFAADVTWAYWAITASAHKPVPSALWSAGIVLLGLVNIDAYILSRWYVIPSAAGAAAGTLCAVSYSKYRNGRKVEK